MLGNVLGVGTGLGPAARTRVMSNLGGEAGVVPNLRVHPKVQKPHEVNGDPRTRPVVGATGGPTVRSGNILSRVLDAVAMAREKQ